jgi:hypothetical protein
MSLPDSTDEVAIKSFVVDWYEDRMPWALQREFPMQEVWCYFPDFGPMIQFEYRGTSWGACSTTCGPGHMKRSQLECFMPLLNYTVAKENCDLYLAVAPTQLSPNNYTLETSCSISECAASFPLWIIAVIAGGVLLLILILVCMSRRSKSGNRSSTAGLGAAMSYKPMPPGELQMASLKSATPTPPRSGYHQLGPEELVVAREAYPPRASPRLAGIDDTLRLSLSPNGSPRPGLRAAALAAGAFRPHYSNYSPVRDESRSMGDRSPTSNQQVNLGTLGQPPYSNYLGSSSRQEVGWDMHPKMSQPKSAASEWQQYKASPEMEQFRSRNAELVNSFSTPESRERARRML